MKTNLIVSDLTKSVLNLISLFFSNTSHPGYDVHYFLILVMVLYTVIVISTDLLFFYFTMYISFRYDLIQNLVGNVGDFKSNYETAAKQSQLLRQIINLHLDTMRFVAIEQDLMCKPKT